MKIVIEEDKSRKIANKQHNVHVANGIDQHRQTSVAPDSLLLPFSDDLNKMLLSRQEYIEPLINETLGKPYFSKDGFYIYHGDSIKLLERISSSGLKIDLTLTSPPYNIGKEYEEIINVSDYVSWCTLWINHIYSLTKPNGALWLNVGYLKVPDKGLCVPIPYLLWNKTSFYLLQEVVWKYGAGVSAKNRLCPRNEKWLFYVKNSRTYTFNLDDIRDPNVKYPNQKKNGKFRCNPLGKNPSDVWEFPKVTTGKNRSSKERTGHPAQFPLGIVERVIKASSNQGEIVIDPFAGSFSAGIATHGLGRIFIGFEINEKYCQLAVERFNEFQKERQFAQSQLALF